MGFVFLFVSFFLCLLLCLFCLFCLFLFVFVVCWLVGWFVQEGDENGLVSLSELQKLSFGLGITEANAALLFSMMDVDSAGFLTQEQFVVMAPPNCSFRLTNSKLEHLPFNIYEIRLFSDTACTSIKQ